MNDYDKVVSMPYIGLPPFLHILDEEEFNHEGCVNALYRASPISTESEEETPEESEDVSMPYIGLPPFLHKSSQKDLFYDTVSMPYIGLPPFLPLSLQKPFKINGFRGRFQGVIVRKF